MRGSPVLRALVALLLLLALAPLIAHITRSAVAKEVSPEPAAATQQKVQLELSYTHPPQRIRISHLGAVVWEKANPAQEEITLSLPWPREGGELHFAVDWPASIAPAALRARLTDPAGHEWDRTLWGSGPSEEVLSFP